MVRIVLEATGCDDGFQTSIGGAILARKKDPSLEIILVAGEDHVTTNHPRNFPGIHIEYVPSTFSDKNRKRKDTSIYRAMEMHKSGEVDAVLAPGDTMGSVMAALDVLGLIKHVESPAICASYPLDTILVDAGANPDSSPKTLKQNAILGNIFSKYYFGIDQPKISLLSIGTEAHKSLIVPRIAKAERLIRKLGGSYSFYQNKDGDCYIEANFMKQFLRSQTKGVVVVTDGFNGNSILKAVRHASPY